MQYSIYTVYSQYTTIVYSTTYNTQILFFPLNYQILIYYHYLISKTLLSTINDINTIGIVKKIQFKGKGSWINIRRIWPAVFFPKFGRNRPLAINYNNYPNIRFKKHLFYHSLIIHSTNFVESNITIKNLLNFRPLNHYTLKGLRTARYTLKKRQGKISQYKHLKGKIF